MKHRRPLCASAAVIAAVIIVVSFASAEALSQPFAANLQNALACIPADYQFISGTNGKRIVDSSLHAGLEKDRQAAGQMLKKFCNSSTAILTGRSCATLVDPVLFRTKKHMSASP
jgi:hypothetical protein